MEKLDVIKQNQLKEGDTGSAEVQIALFTNRIASLTEHLKVHKLDNHSRSGLLKIVNKRAKMLKYLEKTDVERYRNIKQKLSIR